MQLHCTASSAYLYQVPFNQTAIQLSTVGASTQVVPAGPACVSGWQAATGCAIDCHYSKGAAFADKTKEERGEEKPKHMDGYFCRNQPHMLEAPSARRKDGTQFATLVMSQCRVRCCDHSFCNCVAILEKIIGKILNLCP